MADLTRPDRLVDDPWPRAGARFGELVKLADSYLYPRTTGAKPWADRCRYLHARTVGAR